MSDGITDASRNDKEAIRKFRQSIRKEVIESFATSELINELCKREGVTSYYEMDVSCKHRIIVVKE